jgi:NAD(P) transhydrogenase subunit beta
MEFTAFDAFIQIAYMISVALFIFGLKMLGSPATAQKGNKVSMLGMAVAIATASLSIVVDQPISMAWVIIGFIAGGAIGGYAAKVVEMTEMPEMVALFNGSGGIASLVVGMAEFYNRSANMNMGTYEAVVITIAVLIGGLTFTGSLIAWGKLSGAMPQKAITMPGQNIVVGLVLIGALAFAVIFAIAPLDNGWAIYGVAIISLILGILAVNAIGGGDMPVVISLLNSYSGMAAAAAGFVVKEPMLIITGALVGSSGIILTIIMCKAMNRSLTNVLFSAFGSDTAVAAGSSDGPKGEVKPMTPEDAYYILEAASSVVIVPGYGMAVAQAQHVVKELADILADNDTEVYYAVHPVAGRMPGHMNVLLAEANVPYDQLYEMDDINPKMADMDVAIVVGANDVVNPAARHDESSPIYGMPIIDVDKARTSFVLKRSMAAGFAGVQNELFFYPNNRMIFGDAKDTFNSLIAQFKNA